MQDSDLSFSYFVPDNDELHLREKVDLGPTPRAKSDMAFDFNMSSIRAVRVILLYAVHYFTY